MSAAPEMMANQMTDVDARPAQTVRLWHRLVRHRSFQIGSIGVLILAAVAIVGPLLVGDPDQTNYKNKLATPSAMHWLGTDSNGRDLLARGVHGAGISFEAALIVFVLTTVIGIGLGVPAGLIGGPFDIFVSRICDVMLGLPSLVLALAVVGALGPGFGNLVLAMSLTGWAGLAKLSRSLALSSRNRPDVLAARMAGIGRARIAVGHVLPGVFAHSLIAATLGLGETILGLAGLSFLGLGVQPPTAEWGSMLNESRIDLSVAPWLLIGPGIGLIITVTAITLISDALRDCADVSELA